MVTRSCCAVVALLVLLPACSNKRRLDQAADQLIQAIEANDYAAFRELAHPTLRRHLPPKALRVLSQTFSHLGKLEDRTMARIEVQSDGTSKAQYRLSFAKGQGAMAITLKDSEVREVELGGEALLQAMKAVRSRGYGKLGVLAFKWLAAGPPKAGEKLTFRLDLGGLGYDDKGVAAVASLVLMDSLGRVVADRPRFAQVSRKLDRHEPPVAAVEGAVTPPGGGRYRLDITVHDLKSGRTVDHNVALDVAGPPASRPATLPAPDAGPPAEKRAE
jgi:hypothetical protein